VDSTVLLDRETGRGSDSGWPGGRPLSVLDPRYLPVDRWQVLRHQPQVGHLRADPVRCPRCGASLTWSESVVPMPQAVAHLPEYLA